MTRRTVQGGTLPKAARTVTKEIGRVVDSALNGGMTEREFHYALIIVPSNGQPGTTISSMARDQLRLELERQLEAMT